MWQPQSIEHEEAERLLLGYAPTARGLDTSVRTVWYKALKHDDRLPWHGRYDHRRYDLCHIAHRRPLAKVSKRTQQKIQSIHHQYNTNIPKSSHFSLGRSENFFPKIHLDLVEDSFRSLGRFFGAIGELEQNGNRIKINRSQLASLSSSSVACYAEYKQLIFNAEHSVTALHKP